MNRAWRITLKAFYKHQRWALSAAIRHPIFNSFPIATLSLWFFIPALFLSVAPIALWPTLDLSATYEANRIPVILGAGIIITLLFVLNIVAFIRILPWYVAGFHLFGGSEETAQILLSNIETKLKALEND